MEPRREAEADARLLDALPDPIRRELDRDPERLEDVGRAALRRRRSRTVLRTIERGLERSSISHTRNAGRVSSGHREIFV